MHHHMHSKKLGALLVMSVLAGFSVRAEDMPFWTEGAPRTNRVATVVKHHGISFSSIICVSRRHAFDMFRSTKRSLVVLFH